MTKKVPNLEFKSTSLLTLRIILNSADTGLLLQDLQARLASAGDFYANESVVLDALELEQAPDWQALVQLLRQYKLYPIGVQAKPEHTAQALQAGLAPVGLTPARPERASSGADTKESPAGAQPSARVAAQNPPAAARPPAEPAPAVGAKIVRQPLRSGQRIYAQGTDLIVLGMVSTGAELIADGNIHVYGPLRGKAMAGASGNKQAMIFTTQLDPQLVAIAGIYRVIETRLPNNLHNQAARIELDGETIRMHALTVFNP